MKKTLSIAIGLGLLSACGGSGSTNPPDPGPTPVDTVPEINAPQAFAGRLANEGASAFELYVKNGIYVNSTGDSRVTDASPVAAPPAPEASSGSGNFSTTNTQEEGVDEADRIEYDGSHLFIATQAVWRPDVYEQPAIRILARNDDFSMAEVNRIEVEEENTNITGMYLYQDSLSVVSSGYPIVTFADIAATSFLPGTWQEKINLSVYDTGDPAAANLTMDIDLEGWLIGSRRIDNYVYLIAAYHPSIANLPVAPESDQEKIETYNAILDTPMSDIMPKITVNGVERTLNEPEDCLIPESATENDGYAQILSIVRVNVDSSDDISSVCMSAYADMSYMSPENLYLGARVGRETNLHKISVGGQFQYQASGSVSGGLGWNNPNLRLSENQGYLRVVTTDWSSGEPEHSLHVLNQSGSALEGVATLPNEQQPDAIGKPGEDIYAVRFIEDKAYVVTFERIDPLYVIDLTDNTAPVIAGELEIPGFSSYLHPMANGYLLGVGQEVNGGAIPETGANTTSLPPPVQPTGMKVTLFDVSDPANPMEVSSVVREGTYTPVEYDYRALSVLKTGDSYQFALPTETWGSVQDEAGNDIWSAQSKLLMMDVNAASGQGSLSVTHELQAINDPEYYVGAWEDRSVIHDDHVYYLHGNAIWHSLWQEGAQANGPY